MNGGEFFAGEFCAGLILGAIIGAGAGYLLALIILATLTQKETVTMSNPKAKSPYQRKQKKPHVYSELSERQLEVWQYLVTSGYAWTLPGRYGRMAQALIDNGEIEDPREFGLRASA